MKLQVLSDLHIDSYAKRQKPLGKHGYFSEDVLAFDDKLSQWDTFDKASSKGLKFLQCQQLDFGEIRILGCTLWTDYQFEATSETRESVMAFMRGYRRW